ncbi:O-antigen ligase family protein [Candidatus Peregrinibacteria bacterium]|nr:O-antigen ligase family protein [Candidatus Peregrinibacteria bacterium]
MMIFCLPIAFSLETFQVFEINKFSLFVLLESLILLLFAIGLICSVIQIFIPQKFGWTQVFFLLFLLSIVLSGALGHAPLLSFWGSSYRHFGGFLVIHLLLLGTLISALRPTEKERFTFFIFPLLLGGILQGILGIFQYISPESFFTELKIENAILRSYGTLGHPNFFAQFLLFPFFGALGILFNRKERLMLRIFALSAALFSFLGIILSQGRGVFLGLIFGSVLFILLSVPKCGHFLMRYLGKIFVGMSLFAVGIAFSLPLFFPYLESFLGERARSVETRMLLWEKVPEMISEAPFFGVGLENFPIAIAPFISPKIFELEHFMSFADRSHNFFLDILVQCGIFGFFSFLGFLYCVFSVKSRKKFHQTNRKYIAGITAILVAWQFGFPVVTDAVLFTIFLALFFTPSSQKSSDTKMKWRKSISVLLVGISVFSLFGMIRIWNADRLFLNGTENNNLSEVVAAAKSLPWERGYLSDAVSMLQAENRLPEAEKMIRKFLKLNPFSGEGYYLLASTFFQKNEYDLMEMALQKMEKLDPKNPKLWELWGNAEYAKKNYEAAEKKFEHYLKIAPKYWKIPENDREKNEKIQLFFEENPNFWENIQMLAETEKALKNEEKYEEYCAFLPSDSFYTCK